MAAAAEDLEVISPAEAQLRVQTGSLANGSAAPPVAMVDTQAGPVPNSAPAEAANRPSYWDAPIGEGPKAVKSPASTEPAANRPSYWDVDLDHTPPAPPAAKAPAPKPSMWRRALDAYTDTQASIGHEAYEGVRGLGGVVNESSAALNTLAAPLVQSVESWRDILTGKVNTLDKWRGPAPTDWQDWWFRNMVDPTVENAKDFATDESAPFADKAAHAIGATLGYIAEAVVTAGEGEALPAATQVKSGLQVAKDVATQGVNMAQAPAISQAVNVGREAYQSTNDPELAFRLAAITYSSSVEQNMLPLAMPGKLLTRAATGGGMQLAGGELSREAYNAQIPDEHADMRQPFSAEQAVLNLTQGAVMGGVAGPSSEMPHSTPQVVEVPHTVMELAQIHAADAVKADGGDLLDQTVAATHANAVVGAHHDAAEYEGNLRVAADQREQLRLESEQEEAKRVQAAAFEQAEKQKAAVAPEDAFAQRDRELQQARDADYQKALNQRGDQEIERGNTLAVGAEKGREGAQPSTLADILKPDELAAFKSLAERRQAEMAAARNPPSAPPDERFMPYVEPKAAKPAPRVDEEAEPPAEGDSWKTQNGTLEVLKDHGDGTYTIRSTPDDSTLAPRRQKVSEAALIAMKARAEAAPEAAETPNKAPQTLADRRQAAGVEAPTDKGAARPVSSAEAARAISALRRQQAEAPPATLAARREANAEALSPDSQRIAQQFAREKEFNQNADYQRLMNAKSGEHEGIVKDMPIDQAQSHLDRLNAAPGENAAAQSALESRIEAGRAEVETGAHEAATSPKSDEPMPTEAQQNAGNFRMGKIEVGGLPISIEHPEGSTRPSGATIRDSHYGYIRGTVDADGMHTDVFVGKHPESGTAFIVDHLDHSGEYQQHKILMGFPNRLAAMKAYRSAFKDNPLGPVSEVRTSELKDWLKNGDTTRPYDQRGVNRLADARGSRFADGGAAPLRPEDVKYTRNPNGTHVAETAHGKTTLIEKPNGNLQVKGTKTQPGMRGAGEGTARVERAALEAHSTGGKLESDTRVSRPAQAIYEKLRERGYDIKENPARVDPGTGEKVSASDLKPVYEVGPKRPMARDSNNEPATQRVTQEQATVALKPLTDRIGSENLAVHDTAASLPDCIQKAMSDYNHPDPRGVFDTQSGQVHIVASAHESPDEVMRTAVHEIVGHKGLRALLGDDHTAAMADVWREAPAAAKAWMKEYAEQHGLDLANKTHQGFAAEEYAAHLAEYADENPGMLRKVMDSIRAGLRKLGLVREWNDNDIRALLRKSASNLESEHARAAAAYKGSGLRFADAEDHTAERYPPDHPLAQAHKFGMTMEAQANYNQGFVRSRGDWLKDGGIDAKNWIADKALNTLVDQRLNFIGLRNLPDFMNPKLMPSLRQFVRVHDQLTARANELVNRATEVARDWSRYVTKDKARGAALGDLMHASTIGGVDPSKAFEPRYSEAARAADPKKQAHDDRGAELHRQLRKIYETQLDAKGRELYQTVRDSYRQQRLDTQKALEQRIAESGADGATKKALIAELRQKFEAGRVQGPYFPLARFGDHWASAKDDNGNTVSFSRFESRGDQRAWLDAMQSKGYKTDAGQRMDDRSVAAKVDPRFVQRISELAKDVDPGLADEIWQEYLRALPEMSVRKQFIHRQGRLGFTMDALRAFSSNSYRGAQQTARLEYSHRLESTLGDIKQEAQAVMSDAAANPNDALRQKNAAWAPALAREMGRRYDWIQNPHSSSWASALTKAGFYWYLGAAPATAFRIFSQNPMIAQPVLAGYHGQLGATRELARASYQWATSRGSLGDKLRGDERDAFNQAAQTGIFSNNNTNMLASGGKGGPVGTGKAYYVQKAASFLFNAMENHNRQTTFLAGYRLGRAQGLSHGDAIEHAADMTWDSHFDYSEANRPRAMQNDVVKVAALFRQYSLGVTYRLAREARDMFDAELSPADRMVARKTFAGLTARCFMFAGVTGLPLAWLANSVISAVMGTKDHPVDAQAEAHAYLAQHLGQTAADAIITGPMGAITGASLSGGASYSDLWYRSPTRDESPPDTMKDAIVQATGAIPAIAVNAAEGYSMIKDGQTERGFEHFVPPEAAALMKAYRYSQEGAKNLQGEDVVPRDQISAKDVATQALGFTPQKLADQFAENNALKNITKEIQTRRADIMNRLAVAVGMDDAEEQKCAYGEIEEFNKENPKYPIDYKSIHESMHNRLKDQAEAVNGVRLPRGLEDLRDTYSGHPPGSEPVSSPQAP